LHHAQSGSIAPEAVYQIECSSIGTTLQHISQRKLWSRYEVMTSMVGL
jgi:hypothetical protein